MNAQQTAARNEEIVTARARGIGPSTIARTFDLHEDHVRRILREYDHGRPPLTLSGGDPARLVRDQLDALDAAIEELALLSAGADNSSARVGAIGKRLDALRQKRELMQATGMLPHDLGTLHVSVDLQAMAMRVLEVFPRFDLPLPVQEAIIDAIDPPQRPALEGKATERKAEAKKPRRSPAKKRPSAKKRAKPKPRAKK